MECGPQPKEAGEESYKDLPRVRIFYFIRIITDYFYLKKLFHVKQEQPSAHKICYI